MFGMDNLAKSRGLDPQALKTLALRKKGRDDRSQSLRQKNALRDINTLRARLTVLDREIQRLSVGERRNRADVARGRGELSHELADVEEVSKALDKELAEFKKIELAIGKERSAIGRLRSAQSQVKTSDVERQLSSLQTRLKQIDVDAGSVDAKRKRLMAEITQLDHEMTAIESQRARIMNEVTQHQTKLASGTSTVQRVMSDLEKHQAEMDKLISEQDHHGSAMRQLKAQLMREQREAKAKAKLFEQVGLRLQGKEQGVPALERDRAHIEQQIRNLEKELRSS